MNEFLDIAVDIAVQLESELAPLTTVTSLNHSDKHAVY